MYVTLQRFNIDWVPLRSADSASTRFTTDAIATVGVIALKYSMAHYSQKIYTFRELKTLRPCEENYGGISFQTFDAEDLIWERFEYCVYIYGAKAPNGKRL